MKYKESAESGSRQRADLIEKEPGMNRRQMWKQTALFLVICLPVTWFLMGIGYQGATMADFVPWVQLLINLACYLPAIAAIIASMITRESLWKLSFLPRFQGNAKVYFSAILIGIFIICMDLALMTMVFPQKASFQENVSVPMLVFQMLFAIANACVLFFVSMGEELGWMGYLFPRLEKLCGTTVALIVTGFIRGCWHLVMLAQMENFWASFLTLCISNILLGSILVWVTKASKSVVPASIIHALTNGLPSVLAAYMVLDESSYGNGFSSMDLVGMLPSVMVAAVCYIILIKKYKVEKLPK